jgi:cytochrome P450
LSNYSSPEVPGKVLYDPFAGAIQDDPYPSYAALLERAPVFYNEEREFFALSRFGDVQAAFRD